MPLKSIEIFQVILWQPCFSLNNEVKGEAVVNLSLFNEWEAEACRYIRFFFNQEN